MKIFVKPTGKSDDHNILDSGKYTSGIAILILKKQEYFLRSI